MKPTYFGLLYNRWTHWINICRKWVLKRRGMIIKEGGNLGRISCNWPNKLSIGSACDIQDNVDFRIWHPFGHDTGITIGDRVFIGNGCEFVCNTRITIGNDCLIASGTTFVDVGHSFEASQKMNVQERTFAEITIGEDVWIGTSCQILQGVSIGSGSIIGAGSVVNKSVPSMQIWAGVPAKFIKNRA